MTGLRMRAERGHREGKQKSLGTVARVSVLWAYIRTVTYSVIAVPTTIILARLLSPSDFGVAAAGAFFASLANRLTTGGMAAALIRMPNLRPEHISTVFVLNCIVSAFGVVVLSAAAPWIGQFYGSPEVAKTLPLVSMNFAFGALSVTPQALLSRDLRYREMAALGSIDVATASVVACVLAWNGFGYWSLVMADVSGAAVKWLFAARLTGWHLRFRLHRDAFRELMSFAMGSYFKRILDHATLNLDNVVVGRNLGVTALGFYDKAFSIFNQVFNKMTVVGPAVSFRVFAIIQDDPERFRRAYAKVVLTVTLIGYSVFAGLGTMAPHLIVVVLGAKWWPAIVPFQLLCITGMVRLLNAYAGPAAQARGWIWSQVWRQAVQVAFMVAGVYVGSRWGINGAAAAVLLANVLMFFLMQTLMQKATGLSWSGFLQPQMPALVCSAIMAAMLWGIDIAAKSLEPARPSAAGVLIAQATTATLFAFLFVRHSPFPEVREIAREIVGDLSPRVSAWLFPRSDATEAAS